MSNRKRLVKALRDRFWIREHDATDTEVLRITKGTLGRGGIECRLSFEDLRVEIWRAIKKDAWRVRRLLGGNDGP